MANTNKVYTISIQMDAARQQLADATKKLAELDESLAGLDRNSDQAKAIIAEMAKLAKEVEGAGGEVKDLSKSLDDLKPGTIPALEAEIEELQAAFERTVIGTKEFDEALITLGNKKGELKKIEDAIDALDPKEKAAAFVDFANGVVGAFTVATTAAQTFGLSKESVEEYQTKLLTLISVMDGVEQVSKALNSETLSVVKIHLRGCQGLARLRRGGYDVGQDDPGRAYQHRHWPFDCGRSTTG
jgi:chromosome segregation ATPase